MFGSDLQAPAIRRREERERIVVTMVCIITIEPCLSCSLSIPCSHGGGEAGLGNNEVLCKDARDDVTGTKICHVRSQSSLQKKG